MKTISRRHKLKRKLFFKQSMHGRGILISFNTTVCKLNTDCFKIPYRLWNGYLISGPSVPICVCHWDWLRYGRIHGVEARVEGQPGGGGGGGPGGPRATQHARGGRGLLPTAPARRTLLVAKFLFSSPLGSPVGKPNLEKLCLKKKQWCPLHFLGGLFSVTSCR